MPGQNVYITPVQQRANGVGGMVWSPYGNEDVLANPAYKTVIVTIHYIDAYVFL